MVSALNLIGDNSQLQSHWGRRLIAIIFDWVIMVVIWIIVGIAIALASIFLPGGLIFIPFFSGILWVIYSGFMEGTGGATIGKRIMNLRVVSLEGPMDFGKAFIRNISKIYGLLLLVDWIAGFVMDGDPRQRLFDRFAHTTVVRTDVRELMPGAFQPRRAHEAGPTAPGQPQPQYGAPQSQPQEPSHTPEGPAPGPEPVTSSIDTPEEESPETSYQKPVEVTHNRSELVALRKDDLEKIARDKGLKISGTKRDLIDRILGEGD
jgi:uncharacterized RDD family membrane protein YckC